MANERWKSDQERDRYREEAMVAAAVSGTAIGDRVSAGNVTSRPATTETRSVASTADLPRQIVDIRVTAEVAATLVAAGLVIRGALRERGMARARLGLDRCGFRRRFRLRLPRPGLVGARSYGRSQGQSSKSRTYGGREDDRGFWDRASDEVSSWFGDDEAERRRRRDYEQSGQHRGRGPKGYTRSDDRIREDLCDRLTADPFVDASDIEISVSSCEVTLSGTIDSREAKRRAEDIADRVSGVSHVQNNLRVQQSSWGGSAAMEGLSGSTTSGGRVTGGTAQTGTSGTTAGSRGKVGPRA